MKENAAWKDTVKREVELGEAKEQYSKNLKRLETDANSWSACMCRCASEEAQGWQRRRQSCAVLQPSSGSLRHILFI